MIADDSVFVGTWRVYATDRIDTTWAVGSPYTLTIHVSGHLLALRAAEALPSDFALHQNYPNPFNPSTTIEFYLPEQQYVTLDIYNILGQRVVSLVDRDMDAGFQSVNWSGRDNSGSEIASGIYFYLLKTDDRKISKRMMMLK